MVLLQNFFVFKENWSVAIFLVSSRRWRKGAWINFCGSTDSTPRLVPYWTNPQNPTQRQKDSGVPTSHKQTIKFSYFLRCKASCWVQPPRCPNHWTCRPMPPRFCDFGYLEAVRNFSSRFQTARRLNSSMSRSPLGDFSAACQNSSRRFWTTH